MALVARTDKGIGPVRFDSEPGSLPTPDHSPAYYDADGHLIVEALIARDGLLRYSDGEGSWLEYRPAEELRKAAPSFAGTCVTDTHPKTMVTPKTWAKVQRGVTMDAPTVVVLDGVTYLQSKLRITSPDLIAKMEKQRRAKKRVELSIGFVCLSRREVGKYHGRTYIAVQTDMRGNHTATLKENEGRSGPSCRVLFDGAECPTGLPMPQDETKKNDAEANPVDMVVITAPDGSEQEVPSWIAAELEALEGLRGNTQPAPPAPPAAPEDAAPPQAPPVAVEAPEDAMGQAPVEAPVAPPAPVSVPDAGVGAPPPARPAVAAPPMLEKPEDRADSLRTRRTIERAASALGADDDKLDASSNEDLQRFVIAEKTRMDAKALEAVEGEALSAMFDSAISIVAEAPAPAPTPTPWPGRVVKSDARSAPTEDQLAMARAMKAQGY